jgi:hypothetical protein
MKEFLTRLLYKLLLKLDSGLEPKSIVLDYKFTGAQPTLRHLPNRLSKEFEHIEDPYIHTIITYLNEAVEELYVINVGLHSKELDRLLSKRFYL